MAVLATLSEQGIISIARKVVLEAFDDLTIPAWNRLTGRNDRSRMYELKK
ncbi:MULTISPECIES: hypothetical protein [Bradyrhizobium]|nr:MULTISPECIES: hypothetical protein [Bradyrhizobium]MDE5446695.1 hypothetical protein [Bradyrhizobium sp. CSA207]